MSFKLIFYRNFRLLGIVLCFILNGGYLLVNAQTEPSFVWVRAGNGAGVDRFNDVAYDEDGFVYAVGDFDEDLIIGTDTFSVVSSGNSCGLITKWDSNGVYQWGMSLGNLGYPINVSDIAISDQNEVYVAGRFSGTCYMGTDTTGNDVTMVSSGSIRSYISRFNTDGELLWTKLLDGTYSNWVWELGFDHQNNLVASGDYNWDIDFGNGHGLTAYQQLETFVAWFDANGNCTNHFGYQGYGEERIYDVAFDAQGNYVIGGAFNDSIFIGNDTLLSNGTGDAFIAYYNNSGVLQWYDYFGGSQSSYINSDMVTNVEFDNAGNIYAAGGFRDTLFFGSDSLISHGNIDAFLIKYDNSGQKLKYSIMGGNDGDGISGLVIGQENSLYLTATGNNMTYGDSTYNYYKAMDIHVIKMNSDLEIEWIKRAGTPQNDYASNLTLLSNGDIYIACQPGDTGPVVFDTVTFPNLGGTDWYSCVLAKLSIRAPSYANVDWYQNASVDMIAYPNPCRDYFKLSNLAGKQELMIADLSGKVIYQDQVTAEEAISTRWLPSGVYFVILPVEGVSIKLVKEN